MDEIRFTNLCENREIIKRFPVDKKKTKKPYYQLMTIRLSL